MTGEDERLAPWLAAPDRAGVLTDFDGTLSPIVDDPEAAQPLPGAVDVLARLAARYRTVAVVSGRPVAYLLDRLGPLPGVTMVGLYGLEKRERGAIVALPEVRRWRQCVDDVAAASEAEAPAGVYVERKGLAVGLHFRQAPEHANWVQAWADQQARQSGLVVHHGKMSLELVPPVSTDKGRVVAALAAGLEAVCYVGDDVGDLPAFAALARLRRGGVATLAVAVRSGEAPPELVAQGDLVVDGSDGALAFLQRLAR
ncbi:MAG: trehalose 6-phosphate phosphatase [Acidimicrobiaceae bacterium]|nr:trehalose 6-phosphate phosphatase [Acidimicrobiaceae bacterium]